MSHHTTRVEEGYGLGKVAEVGEIGEVDEEDKVKKVHSKLLGEHICQLVGNSGFMYWANHII